MNGRHLPGIFMVFDVESIGLQGEAFAVAYVVVNRARETLAEAVLSCHPATCRGSQEGRQWLAYNVPQLRITSRTPVHLRADFWSQWLHWKSQGAALVADCCWPVESRFLADCVDDDPQARTWEGPYPLHDLASARLARGLDPVEQLERRPDELPVHHPLCDARQSARLWLDALGVA
jgi:hypothetical protein